MFDTTDVTLVLKLSYDRLIREPEDVGSTKSNGHKREVAERYITTASNTTNAVAISKHIKQSNGLP